MAARLRLDCTQDAQLSDGHSDRLNRSSHMLMLGTSECICKLGDDTVDTSTHLQNMYGEPANHARQYKTHDDHVFRLAFLHEGWLTPTNM